MARKPRTYLILDTETATLPFANEITSNAKEKRTVAIAKPLVYDIGWKVIDRNGKVYSQHSYLISETFSVPTVFNTAYYKDKRPKYIERLNAGDTSVKQWDEVMEILEQDLQSVDYVGAFNSMFDFKKAIPFTEKYISALYSTDYFAWEYKQKAICKNILKYKTNYKNPDWDGEHFNFRGKDYKLIDLWGISCEMLINTQTYKRKCLQYGMITESGQFFKSSAESTFRYLCDKFEFEEVHMAIDDVIIECQILQKALKRGKITEGLIYFPFQMLGKTSHFILEESKRKIPVAEVEVVCKQIETKLKEYEKESSFATGLERELYKLINYLNERYGEQHEYVIKGFELELKEIRRKAEKLKMYIPKLKSEKAIDKKEKELEKLRELYSETQLKMRMAKQRIYARGC